jgi:2,3-bisphosphoglycerate-independent phosphoglycerate mutase
VNGRGGKIYVASMCGAADRAIAELGGLTPLEYASTPNLDAVARRGAQGLIEIIGEGICPESDSGAMALLSYDPLACYTGRGPLEGLGTGSLAPGANAVSFRVNFASYDAARERLDRRTARDLSETELQALAEEIRAHVSLAELGVTFELTAFRRHRGIVTFASDALPLGGNVSNTDPGFRKVGAFGIPVADFAPRPQRCEPLDGTPASANTAAVVERFVAESARVLSASAVNAARVARGLLPANMLLVRDGGAPPAALPAFAAKFARTLSFYGQIPAEKGLMQLVGGAFQYSWIGADQSEPDYLEQLASAMLRDPADVVFVHLKGADEPGHDGLPADKVRALEAIDRHVIGPLLAGMRAHDVLVATSDHATPCALKIHAADPVPTAVCGGAITADATRRFGERAAARGALPFARAIDLMPYAVRALEAS